MGPRLLYRAHVCGGHIHMLLKRNDEKPGLNIQICKFMADVGKQCSSGSSSGAGTVSAGWREDTLNTLGLTPTTCRSMPSAGLIAAEGSRLTGHQYWMRRLCSQVCGRSLQISPSTSSHDQAFHMGRELLITLSLHLQGWHYNGIFIFPLLL